MGSDYYQILGVASTATRDEVRRAYAKLVRESPPERDAEKFALIRKAYETLSDEAARRDYDALQAHGERVSELVARAHASMAAESWGDAERAWKEILVLWPGSHAASNSLGLCQLELKRWADARRTFKSLTEVAPDVAEYWINYGLGYARESVAGDGTGGIEDDQLLIKARNRFKVAIGLDPRNAMPYLHTARTYVRQGELENALAWFDKAVSADGGLDAADLDTLDLRCAILARLGRRDAIAVEVRRMRSCLPDEPEARKYIASRLVRLGLRWSEARRFDLAHWFALEASLLDPAEETTCDFRVFSGRMAAAFRDVDRLRGDPAVSGPLTTRALYVLGRVSGSIPDADADDRASVRAYTTALDRASSAAIIEDILGLRRRYPALYDLDDELLGHVLDFVGRRSGIPVPKVARDPGRCPRCSVFEDWGHAHGCGKSSRDAAPRSSRREVGGGATASPPVPTPVARPGAASPRVTAARRRGGGTGCLVLIAAWIGAAAALALVTFAGY
ncbi:MAG: DnaJ domain-containing protein [Planctomycetia bacterium]|nr:DnaJ domain-containing protein [Planctomycetia bacterium]